MMTAENYKRFFEYCIGKCDMDIVVTFTKENNKIVSFDDLVSEAILYATTSNPFRFVIPEV